ncbi:hydrogen peroxide-inducible genes activator [Corynebacterium sp. Q4381]|uniref:hydrogen peroxide-inducible genes activator n=1 Tax=Corynebacterium sp. Marseille-Q4381 TaxID=3121597 RepID=UPI002FE6995A
MSNKDYRPTLAQLRTFATIAEHKHFGTAATKLGISQPSLSQALVALESGLGVQLIERSTRKVIVTPTGEQLLPYAKAALEAADAFVVHSRGGDGTLSAPLTIGMIPTIAPYLLPHLLPLVRDEFPQAQPKVVEEQTAHLVSKLRDGLIDVAVLALPVDQSGLEQVELYAEPFVVVTPEGHPLAGRTDLSVSDVGELELLLLDDGHCLRHQILDLCHGAQVNPTSTSLSVTRAASLTTVTQLVMSGMGSTLLPVSALEAECRRPNLRISTFAPDSGAERRVGLAFRTSSSRRADFAALGGLVTRAYEAAANNAKDMLP